MGSIYLRKYGVATTVDFCLYELDGTDLQVAAVHAAGDIAMMKDEGNEAAPAAGFVDEGTGYSLALAIAEMQAARITLYIIDQTSPKAWLDKVLIIETYGNASAQHPFDLATATQDVNLTQIGGVAQSATDLKDFADAGYDPATDKVTGVKLCDRTTLVDLATACTTVTTTTTATSVTDDVGITQAGADKVWGTAARALTDKAGFSLAADQSAVTIGTVNTIAAGGIDGIWDEVIEGALTGRHVMKLNLAALAGKSAGGGTATITFRDNADGKDRITATVDADGNRSAVVLDGA